MRKRFSQTVFPPRILICSLLIACLGACLDVWAQDALPGSKAGAGFTKIQDLNPAQKPLNRPVRQKWAVVIGIGKYRDSRLNSDKMLDKSARRFADYLLSPQGGRFRADHVRVLTNDAASQQSINNSFEATWLGKLAGPDDLVVVYIATKSFPTTDGNSYLCSYNCAMDNIYGTCITIQTLMETLRKNIQSDRIVLILESSGSGSAELSGAKSLEAVNCNVDLERLSLGKGFVILSSSLPDQLSWGDIFSDNLISSLKEKDGLIPLQEAFLKTRQKTEYDSVNRVYGGHKQTPVMKSDWTGNDLIIGCVPLDQTSGIPDSARNFIGAEAHYLNANRAVLASDYDKAFSEYKQAIATDPSLTDARADYAVALCLKGDWQSAEVELRKAIALKGDDPLYLTNYARILDKLGAREECKRMLEKAYLLNPKDRVVLIALCDKCVATGDQQTAMRLADQALVLYPNNAVVQDRMSFLLSLQGRTDEAFSHAQEAVKLDPELTSARLKLGALYVMRGDPQSGIKEYQSVLRKNDKNVDARYLLAEALDKNNDRQGAVEEFKKFLDLAAPNDSRRAAVEERLKAE
jgi:tetratricopeptide (TPR) repeat protein